MSPFAAQPNRGAAGNGRSGKGYRSNYLQVAVHLLWMRKVMQVSWLHLHSFFLSEQMIESEFSSVCVVLRIRVSLVGCVAKATVGGNGQFIGVVRAAGHSGE